MTVHISVPLDENQKAQLDALAEEQNQDAVAVAAQALTEFLNYEMEFRAAVEQGLAAVEAGDVRDLADVEKDLRAYVAERMRQAG